LTVADFSTGTVSITNGLKALTFVGSNIVTAGVQIGRRIKIGSTLYEIDSITGENAATIKLPFAESTVSGGTFTIMGQEFYNLPIQTSQPAILWTETDGYPEVLSYVTDRDWLETEIDYDDSDVPDMYRMWGEDCVQNQPRAASVMTSVSSTTDTAQVTFFGNVSGYPDSETITLNGITPVATTKSFTSIERITKDATTAGRVTITANAGTTTIAVLPVGDTANAYMYKKIQVFPLPDDIYEIHVAYYKEVQRLVGDDDIHELGQDFDEAIILLATAKLQAEQSKEDVKTFFSMYENEIKILKRKNTDRLDWLPRLGRPFSKGAAGFHPFLSYRQVGPKFGPQV
jgi:hypothetical protein